MKPKEFDELIRQKFDQNDFAYSPRNWDRLAEQMDGRAKKRSMIMWLWMPVAGMAASVALAMGVTTMLKFDVPDGKSNEYTQTSRLAKHKPVLDALAMVSDEHDVTALQNTVVVKNGHKRVAKQEEKPAGNGMGIRMANVMNTKVVPQAAKEPVNLAYTEHNAVVKNEPTAKKKMTIVTPGYKTFKEERVAAVRIPAKFSIILSGGFSQGSRDMTGYSAGATVRKMINSKVYVESDVAFTTSDHMTMSNPSVVPGGSSGGGGGTSSGAAAKPGAMAKLSKVESADNTGAVVNPPTVNPGDKIYSLYYAQVTPSIGYKIMKRVSIAAGPDFQQLINKAPDVSNAENLDAHNIQKAPLFDVGLMGKTEFALARKVRAAVYYRKGVNDVINLTGRYINRDYLQFQLKYAIFNK